MRIKISKKQWHDIGMREGWIKKASSEIIRFDTNGRVEIFVQRDDIESHEKFYEIVKSNLTEEKKIELLKAIALEIAHEKLSEVNNIGNGVEVTIEQLSLLSIDIERINWTDMISRQKELEELQ